MKPIITTEYNNGLKTVTLTLQYENKPYKAIHTINNIILEPPETPETVMKYLEHYCTICGEAINNYLNNQNITNFKQILLAAQNE
jgi:hypothetical protein